MEQKPSRLLSLRRPRALTLATTDEMLPREAGLRSPLSATAPRLQVSSIPSPLPSPSFPRVQTQQRLRTQSLQLRPDTASLGLMSPTANPFGNPFSPSWPMSPSVYSATATSFPLSMHASDLEEQQQSSDGDLEVTGDDDDDDHDLAFRTFNYLKLDDASSDIVPFSASVAEHSMRSQMDAVLAMRAGRPRSISTFTDPLAAASAAIQMPQTATGVVFPHSIHSATLPNAPAMLGQPSAASAYASSASASSTSSSPPPPVRTPTPLQQQPQAAATSLSLDAAPFTPHMTSPDTTNRVQRPSVPTDGHHLPSRSIWVGNVGASTSSADLFGAFTAYGPIESLRMLPDKDCAFINYVWLEDAVRAKEQAQGLCVGSNVVRVGYGKQIKSEPAHPNVSGATAPGYPARSSPQAYNTSAMQQGRETSMLPGRALWIGNLPQHTTVQQLSQLFAPFGTIDSCRILTHKNCGFVNYEREEDAINAKHALDGYMLSNQAMRIGFARVPTNPPKQPSGVDDTTTLLTNVNGTLVPGALPYLHLPGASNGATSFSAPTTRAPTPASPRPMSDLSAQSSPSFRQHHQHQYGLDFEQARSVGGGVYANSIPPAPLLDPYRHVNQQQLRDDRRKLDDNCSQAEVTAMFAKYLNDTVHLSLDSVGNTIVQRLMERSSDTGRLQIMQQLAPHIAAVGVNKHGTWVVQKAIDLACTPAQITCIADAICPYTPALLLDQFGNYVVQCCLRLGTQYNQFVFEAIASRCVPISQGRFGARAIRACLENCYTTAKQRTTVARVILQNAPALSTKANSSLLLMWYLDNSDISGRYMQLAQRLIPALASLCVHKVASNILFKIVSQTEDAAARSAVLQKLFFNKSPTAQGSSADMTAESSLGLESVLSDVAHGFAFVKRVLSAITDQKEYALYASQVTRVMQRKGWGSLNTPTLPQVSASGDPFMPAPPSDDNPAVPAVDAPHTPRDFGMYPAQHMLPVFPQVDMNMYPPPAAAAGYFFSGETMDGAANSEQPSHQRFHTHPQAYGAPIMWATYNMPPPPSTSHGDSPQ
ncbi:hypothetical protein RI367_003719 [Sorochytrium milnesiophthora]